MLIIYLKKLNDCAAILLIVALIGMTTRGYDCVVIPGAKKSTASISFPANYIQANRFCGNSKGLTCTGGMGGNACTVCSKFH